MHTKYVCIKLNRIRNTDNACAIIFSQFNVCCGFKLYS